VGIETGMDPALTRSDSMAGSMSGKPGTLPPTWRSVEVEYTLFKKVIGVKGDIGVKKIGEREPLVINVYTAVTSGVVAERGRERIRLQLSKPICADECAKVTISRRIGAGWRLIGYGRIVG